MPTSAHVAKYTFLTTTRLIIISALLAFLVGIISSVGVVQQAYAADDDAYALLYDDGTLVFQRGDTPDDTKGELAATIEVDESAVYSEDSLPPWYTYRENIYEIEFADTITPQSSVSYYFYGLSSCKSMDLTNLNCSKCTYSSSTTRAGGSNNMFDGCSSLVSLVQPSSLTGAYDMSSRFKDCSSLVSLDISGQSSTMVIDEAVFSNCISLRYIKTTIANWAKCYLYSRQNGASTPCDIPAYTGKTWYYINQNKSVVLDTPLTSAFSTGSGGALPTLVGYTTYYDRLPLSECTLSVNLEGDSLSYYVTNSDGAKLTEDMDYALKIYEDAACTTEGSISDLTEYPGVYYFRAEEAADYTAYSGYTPVVPVMTPPQLNSNTLVQANGDVTFDYYFGDDASDISVSSSSQAVIVSVSDEPDANGAYTVTLTPNRVTSNPTTVTLSCVANNQYVSTTFVIDAVIGDPENISDGTFTLSVSNISYAARDLRGREPITLTDKDGNELEEGVFFEVVGYYADEDCTEELDSVYDVGTYYVKVEGIDSYTGNLVASFEVTKATPTLNITYSQFHTDGLTFRYNVLAGRTAASLSYDEEFSTSNNLYENYFSWSLFGEDTDAYTYSVSVDSDDVEVSLDYQDDGSVALNVCPHTYDSFVVTITATFDDESNYASTSVDVKFDVKHISIAQATLEVENTVFTYDGEIHEPTLTVTLDDVVLENGVDYEPVYYSDAECTIVVDKPINAGTYYVRATGIGDYYETTSRNQAGMFVIEQISLSDAEITATLDGDDAVWDGSAKDPDITVVLDGVELVKGVDYEPVYYSDAACTAQINEPVDAGTYYVKAVGIGNYEGITDSASFTIAKATPTLTLSRYELDIDAGDTVEIEAIYTGDDYLQTAMSGTGSVLINWTANGFTIQGIDEGNVTVTVFANATNNCEAVQATLEVTVTGSVSIPTYMVTISSMTNGSVTASTGETTEGEEVRLTVTPNAGYEVASVEVTNNTTGGAVALTQTSDTVYTFKMPASNVTVKAEFSRVVYSITCETTEHGTVTASPETAGAGDTVTLTVSPDDGYMVDTVSLTADSAVTLQDLGNNRYSFVMPASAVTVSAVFAAIPRYSVSVVAEPSEGGTVSADPSSAYEGDTVKVDVTANDGYTVSSVTLTYTSEGSNVEQGITPSLDGTYSFVMPAADVNVQVIFASSEEPTPTPTPSDYSITLNYDDAGGTATLSKNEASEGETITLTVKVEEGFEIGEIVITDAEGDKVAYIDNEDGSYSFVMPASDVTVNVSFAVVTEPGVGDPGDGGDGDTGDGGDGDNGGTTGGTSGNTAGFKVIDEDNTGIGVDIDLLESITNAEGYTGSQLVITPLTEGDSDYDTLVGVATGTLVGVYDVTLYVNGQIQRTDFGTLTLTFPVGEEYNGQTVKLWQLHEGEDPVYYEKVVENGVVTVTVDRLSAFAVDVQTEESGTSSTSGTGTGSGSDSSGSGSGTTTGTGSSGTTSGDDLTKSSDGLSKTGDNTLVGVSLLACIGVIAVAAFVLTGRRRKSAESVSEHKDV